MPAHDSALGALLTSVFLAHPDLSYRSAAKLASVGGASISHATIERLHKGTHVEADRPVRAGTIEALANLPGLSLSQVRRAAAIDQGLPIHRPEEWIKMLTPGERADLIERLRRMDDATQSDG